MVGRRRRSLLLGLSIACFHGEEADRPVRLVGGKPVAPRGWIAGEEEGEGAREEGKGEYEEARGRGRAAWVGVCKSLSGSASEASGGRDCGFGWDGKGKGREWGVGAPGCVL